jgi:osmotically inducible lipoprotein OsmB
MRRNRTVTTLTALLLAASVGGCATWDSMSSQQKSTATGAVIGGAAGAAVSDGSVLGTVGGAAVGGYVGQEVGKRR